MSNDVNRLPPAMPPIPARGVLRRKAQASILTGQQSGVSVERGDAPPHGSALLRSTESAEEMRAVADAYARLGDALFPAKPPVRGAR